MEEISVHWKKEEESGLRQDTQGQPLAPTGTGIHLYVFSYTQEHTPQEQANTTLCMHAFVHACVHACYRINL